MKIKAFFPVMAVALVCLGLFILSPDVAHAAGLFDLSHQHGASLADFGFNHFMHAEPVALVALRGKLDRLKKKADRKLKSITDDMDDAAVRTAETEHEAILREIETVQDEIDDAIARGNTGAPATPPAGDESEAARAAAEAAARAADILAIGDDAGMARADIEAAVRDGSVTVDAFRVRAFDHLAARSRAVRTDPARILRDERETLRAGMVEALAIGLGAEPPQGGPSEAARGFTDMLDVVEFAARAMDHRGRLVTVREREELLTRAFHTTSDFPAIFSDAINTALERRYALAEQSYRRISRRRDFMDFRPHYAVGIGEFPMLEKLTEAGEIKFGTFGEGKEQIAVVPYAKGVRLTRQMLVNDRLGALAEIMSGYGRTVSRFEELTFYVMMLSANTKLADGKVVFHTDHNNLAGSGAAIGTAVLSTGKAAMRKQKGLDGATLNLTPRILLVSPDKEDEALQYLAPISANDSVKVNVHVGTLTPVVAAELSGNAWYLFADPAEAAVYQWGFLDGYTAPRVRFDEPFGTQGIGMTVEHDFGCGAIDFRGGYKNPGA